MNQENPKLVLICGLPGAGAELYVLDPSHEEIKHRLKSRGQEGDDVISNDKIDAYSEKFERPDDAERLLYDNYSQPILPNIVK